MTKNKTERRCRLKCLETYSFSPPERFEPLVKYFETDC